MFDLESLPKSFRETAFYHRLPVRTAWVRIRIYSPLSRERISRTVRARAARRHGPGGSVTPPRSAARTL